MELADLNAAQRRAVTHGAGPILVVAGAGTGKTQVITRRIAYLALKRKVAAEQILALTFTERAAREMEERLDVLLPYGLTGARVMTFNAFGDDLLRRFGIEIGLDPGFRVMSQNQQLVFMHDHLDDFKLDYYAPLGHPTEFLADLARYFGRLKEELVEPEHYLGWAKAGLKAATGDAERLEAAKQLELAQAFTSYQRLRQADGLIDFNDQVSLTLELLGRRPNVLATLQRETRFVMVDEFQDTNLAQAELLAKLAGPTGNIMVVGDDDQSIYKFRGAAISNILGFRERYPKAKTVVLTQNYRSTQEILDSAHNLITHNNPDRLEAKYQIDKRLVSPRRGSRPEVLHQPTWRDEADAVASSIAKLVKSGTEPGEIAVLLRKRNQAQILVNAFNRIGLPHRYQGDDTIYSRPEIKILMYFLQQIIDPRDDVSLYHLLSSEVFAVDIGLLSRASSTARRRNLGLVEILQSDEFSEGQSAELERFLGLNQRWRQATTSLSVGQLSYNFLIESGYLKNLTDSSQSDPLAELKINHLAKFFKQLENYEAVARDKSAYGFVANLPSLELSGGQSSNEPDPFSSAVQILTIHQSKGLEFDTVYIFDLTRGTFPSIRRAERIELPTELLRGERLGEGDWHTAEERRLMYVAMSRAKSRLVASYSSDHGTIQAKKPSPFLAEAFGYEPAEASGPQRRSPLQQIELFSAQDREAPLQPHFLKGDHLELTPHQIDDYLLCPLNFYWLYVLEVPQPLRPALAYGSLIHQVINYYFEQRRVGKVRLAQLDRLIDQLWGGEGYPSLGQAERQQTQAHATIKGFWRREEAARRLPTYTERSFHFQAAPNVVVNGRFDAVYADTAAVEIRDFKTSQVNDSQTADKRAAASIQLAVYGLAWTELMGQIPATLTLDYVETGQIGTAIQTTADQAELVAKITQMAGNLRAGLYPPGKSHFYCIHDKL